MSWGNASMNPWDNGFFQGGGGGGQPQPAEDPYAQERAFQQQIIAQEQARRNQESAAAAAAAAAEARENNPGIPGTRAYNEALQQAAQQVGAWNMNKQRLDTVKELAAQDRDMWKGMWGSMGWGGQQPSVPTQMPNYGPAPNRPSQPAQAPQYPAASAMQKKPPSPLGQSLMRD